MVQAKFSATVQHSTKRLLTTKSAKDTNGSDIAVLVNLVVFAPFVVKLTFLFVVACPLEFLLYCAYE